jgi:hypothetical protein
MGLYLPERSHLRFSVLRLSGTGRRIGGIDLYFESRFAEPRFCGVSQDSRGNHILLYGKSDGVQLERPKYDATMQATIISRELETSGRAKGRINAR